MDSDDTTVAKKLQKAGREKLRRDRLNEHFIELGKALDADWPKGDKVTILSDTIHLLKELTSETSKLKADHDALSEESSELTQEKNDLREEKGALISDIERLTELYQQRLGSAYPWMAVDHSVLPHPPSYPYPIPIPIPSAPVPMHPCMQSYPFFGNPSPGIFPNPCSTFIPCMNPNVPSEQQSTQYVSSFWRPGGGALVSGEQVLRNSSDKERKKECHKNGDSNDVATDLELKTPGSTTDEATSSEEKKSEKLLIKKSIASEESSCSRCCSSHSIQDSSLNSIAGSRQADD